VRQISDLEHTWDGRTEVIMPLYGDEKRSIVQLTGWAFPHPAAGASDAFGVITCRANRGESDRGQDKSPSVVVVQAGIASDPS
jgi:hypothetical protein